jgi:hypothetical protein
LKQNCERGPFKPTGKNHARSPTSHQVWASVAYAGHLPGWTGYITGFKTEVNAVGQFKDLLSTTADLKRQERCVGIISSPVPPKTSNNIIQKGLAFIRERSGSVTVPGATRPRDPAPPAARPRWGCGGGGNDASSTQWRIPMARLTDTQPVILSSASRRDDRGVDLPTNVTRPLNSARAQTRVLADISAPRFAER